MDGGNVAKIPFILAVVKIKKSKKNGTAGVNTPVDAVVRVRPSTANPNRIINS
jgi:hypothetical protein